jgi:hypothetical protein
MHVARTINFMDSKRSRSQDYPSHLAIVQAANLNVSLLQPLKNLPFPAMRSEKGNI